MDSPLLDAQPGLGQFIALGVMISGMALHAYWLIIAGFFIMISAQVEDQGVFFQSVVDTVHMREVMLTDFATLSPSDTLADALFRCVHSLQEDFRWCEDRNWSGSFRGSELWTHCVTMAMAISSRSCRARSRWHGLKTHLARRFGAFRADGAFSDPRHRKRQGGWYRQRAELDEFDVTAG